MPDIGVKSVRPEFFYCSALSVVIHTHLLHGSFTVGQPLSCTFNVSNRVELYSDS